jgi:hypothetical protein
MSQSRIRSYIPAAIVENHKAIARRLHRLKGGQSELRWAIELGIPQQTLNHSLNGVPMHQDFLILLAKKEKISLDWLLLGKSG